jgi:hypothetical protein
LDAYANDYLGLAAASRRCRCGYRRYLVGRRACLKASFAFAEREIRPDDVGMASDALHCAFGDRCADCNFRRVGREEKRLMERSE